jgi:hypothetical protein
MKRRNLNNRESRIIARGEISGHSHIITGECEIWEENNEVYVKAGKNCAIKHLLEQPFVQEGLEKWTEEHEDINLLNEGDTYKYIQQIEYNPYEKAIRNVQD